MTQGAASDRVGVATTTTGSHDLISRSRPGARRRGPGSAVLGTEMDGPLKPSAARLLPVTLTANQSSSSAAASQLGFNDSLSLSSHYLYFHSTCLSASGPRGAGILHLSPDVSMGSWFRSRGGALPDPMRCVPRSRSPALCASCSEPDALLRSIRTRRTHL